MNQRKDDGFTLIELLIVVAIISVIAAIAIPNLLRNKMTASETSAIASLQAISKAEMSYATSCGNGGFATSLTVLGVPTPGTNQGFLAPDMTSSPTPVKSGYTFTLAPGAGAMPGPNDCNGTATQMGYYATAIPVAFGSSGSKSFATNADMTVYQVYAAAAPTEPFGPPATPIQ